MADDEIVRRGSSYLGVHTNNFAEYRGLIDAITCVANLKKNSDLEVDSAEFVMDSELVVMQMKGEYRVKDKDLRGLHTDAKLMTALIPEVSFRHVRRTDELIPIADGLVNDELDRHEGLRRGLRPSPGAAPRWPCRGG